MFFTDRLTAYFLIALFLNVIPYPALAGDLDDGISKYTDDSVAKYDELGKPDKNIKFIIRKAKSQAAMARKNGDDSSSSGGGGAGEANMNSVVMGAGSNIKGDIIIIDESKGDKTQVAE